MSDAAFALTAFFMVAAALWAVTANNVLHAALGLIAAFFATAVLYLGLRAEFLAVAQVLVYIGGVVVFVVFTILLTSRLGDEILRPSLWRVLLGVLFAGAFFAVGALMLSRAGDLLEGAGLAPEEYGSLMAVGNKLLGMGEGGLLLPFEVVSVLLLACVIGAIAVARKPEDDE